MTDTIVAISTALGIGAISIIRLSGLDSINIVKRIFKGKDLNQAVSHTITYGNIVENDEIIDKVLVSVMKAPKTFTGEDIVEINCHGGISTTNKILELLLNNGARLAEAGEFTKRAYINGKMDLIEANAVMDLISSKTEKARRLAMSQLNGNVSNMINKLRGKMLDIMSNIEVNIDYPEYEDILVVTKEMLEEHLNGLKKELTRILEEAKNGKIIKDGVKTVIVGKPNVGKSSILNKLLNEEKAIVTDIEGTTRDVVEGNFSINGVLFNVLDTAGIRETTDLIEKIGVDKSRRLIEEADLVILVLNNAEELSKEDSELLEITKDKKRIVFVNKVDLESKIDVKDVDLVYGSTLTEKGIDSLKERIIQLFSLGELETSDLNFLSNSYQISIIKECLAITINISEQLSNNTPIDIIEIDIKKIWELLGKLVGDTSEERFIDNLFSKFCVGK